MAWQYRENEKFVNPYNFVRMGVDVTRKTADEYRVNASNTGVIRCKMTLKSPVCIPDHETATKTPVEDGFHYTYEFFRVNNAPCIPGSEIRGVIRSVYEAATNSCMSVCDDSPLSSRTPGPKKPGMLVKENGAWKLYKADAYLIRTFGAAHEKIPYVIKTNAEQGYKYVEINSKEYRTGSEISFDSGEDYLKKRRDGSKIPIGKMATNPGNGRKRGVLLIGERARRNGGHRHHSHIFALKDNANPINMSDDILANAVKNLRIVLKYYRDEEDK